MSLGVLSAKRRVLSALVALTMPLLVVLAPAAHAQSAPQPGDPKSGKHRLHAAAEPRHDVPNRLLKEQLSEEEEEDSDNPALSALCQTYIGKPNPYPALGPTVLYGRRGRPGHRVRPAQHGVLRDAGVQPGRGARHPAARERHRGVRLA